MNVEGIIENLKPRGTNGEYPNLPIDPDYIDVVIAELQQLEKEIAELREKLVDKEQDVFQSDIEIINENLKLQTENNLLKAKLENAIVPKFKIGQEVWFAIDNATNSEVILAGYVNEIHFGNPQGTFYELSMLEFPTLESELFASQVEAQASLVKDGE